MLFLHFLYLVIILILLILHLFIHILHLFLQIFILFLQLLFFLLFLFVRLLQLHNARLHALLHYLGLLILITLFAKIRLYLFCLICFQSKICLSIGHAWVVALFSCCFVIVIVLLLFFKVLRLIISLKEICCCLALGYPICSNRHHS